MSFNFLLVMLKSVLSFQSSLEAIMGSWFSTDENIIRRGTTRIDLRVVKDHPDKYPATGYKEINEDSELGRALIDDYKSIKKFIDKVEDECQEIDKLGSWDARFFTVRLLYDIKLKKFEIERTDARLLSEQQNDDYLNWKDPPPPSSQMTVFVVIPLAAELRAMVNGHRKKIFCSKAFNWTEIEQEFKIKNGLNQQNCRTFFWE